ncbi:phosphonate C-P lyase system protein PhnH [Arthrobacter sulfonylureivorans]|uniref:Phosphonate C-P lyase system protein PhnH n=1 Tax=Arthrobacter sulfonylureivorans TaxID=2486855 RepID=A0ABY3WF22_9MICC|nr:phosphonate C-P lyase system protein PhnH [Arthrobacter sulfonylureivorans]UNK47825.1 phosphonate C-P lyase system protein PhnH [Arthrobacter sulfonylureivorans]
MKWDPIHDSRRTFLACLQAQCAPGIPAGPVPAPGLSHDPALDTAAAVLLSLLDPGLTLALIGPEAGTLSPLYDLTGAAPADPAEADFVLISGDPGQVLGTVRCGDRAHPETGATVIVTGTARAGGQDAASTPVTLAGPGIETSIQTVLPLTGPVLRSLEAANSVPPTGIDLLLTGGGVLTALPRTTQIQMEAA